MDALGTVLRIALQLLVTALACGAVHAAEHVDLVHGGLQRGYLLHVPPRYEPGKAAPLVIALHGTNMMASHMLEYTDLARKADEVGFLLALPKSTGFSFNNGLVYPGSATADDVGFVVAVAEDMKRRHAVRADAIYVVGFSNGGSLAQRIQIESDYPFAGFASVAGVSYAATEGVKRPAPLVIIFGNEDPLSPVMGGEVTIPVPSRKPSHMDSAAAWAARLKCTPAPVESSPVANLRVRSWPGCAAGARFALYQIRSLGHHWSGAAAMPFPTFIIGEQVKHPNMTDLIWDYLAGGN